MKDPRDLTCRCQYGCQKKLNKEERQRLFTEFYQLSAHAEQNKYLFGLLSKKEVKRRKRTESSVRSRKATIVYCIGLKDGTRVQVIL